MNLRISKRSGVPVRQQIAAQIEVLIGTGKLKPGDALPSVRALARQLRIHHNTVSQAYQDVTSLHLLSRKRGARLVVPAPDEHTASLHPDLDDLINQSIRLARRHGYSLTELSERVRQRLMAEPPDHVLALSTDSGMLRLMKAELEHALHCRVETCVPEDLLAKPELAMGALVVGGAGVLPSTIKVLPKDHPIVSIQFSSEEPQLNRIRELSRPSILALASVSPHLLQVARGLLTPLMDARHTLVECLLKDGETPRIPTADLVICDAIVFARVHKTKLVRNSIAYHMISHESLAQIERALAPLGTP